MKGHPLTDDNTYLHKGGNRDCRECRRIRGEERRARAKAARAVSGSGERPEGETT